MLARFGSKARGKDCARDQSGSTMIEYALLASLIAIAIIGGLQATGNSIGGMMDGVFAKISAALAGG
ncbi:Flp family type IVb pilin [Aureimonas ureilytica]|uniref:Flp family type IVb pilin n=1 Tax=Aureimonas ureilytica TaxID=401562 RepID=UPI003CF2AA86